METRLDETADALVVRPSGRLDGSSSAGLEALLLARIDAGARAVVFDCAGLSYISSAGLRVVMVLGKRLRAVGGRLAICALNDVIGEVFRISGFASLFPIYDDVAAALAGLAAEPGSGG